MVVRGVVDWGLMLIWDPSWRLLLGVRLTIQSRITQAEYERVLVGNYVVFRGIVAEHTRLGTMWAGYLMSLS